MVGKVLGENFFKRSSRSAAVFSCCQPRILREMGNSAMVVMFMVLAALTATALATVIKSVGVPKMISRDSQK